MVYSKQPLQIWWSAGKNISEITSTPSSPDPRDDSILNTIPDPVVTDAPTNPFSRDEVEEAIKRDLEKH